MNFEKICRNCPDEPWCIQSRGTGCGEAKWETAVLLGPKESEEMNPMDLEQGEEALFHRASGRLYRGVFIAYEERKDGSVAWFRPYPELSFLSREWRRPKKIRLPKMGDLIVVSNVPFEETDDSGLFVLFHSFNDKGRALQLCTHGEEGIEYDYWRFPKKSDFKGA